MIRRLKQLSSLVAALALFPAATSVAAVSGNPSMQDSSTTTVTSPLARLEVTARYDRGQQKLDIRWNLSNTGDQPLAVFDRGDTMAARRKPLAADGVAEVARKPEGDTLVLSHRAMALPQPAPTVPPVPLAGRVAADGTRQAHFQVDLLTVPAGGVRYCLGVAPFDADDYTPAEKIGEGTWRASFKVVDRQTLLCTPVFDLDSGHFASDHTDAE